MPTKYFECIERQSKGQHVRQYAHATANCDNDVLLLSVKQYKSRREARPGDVTIIAGPAMSCAKELYEPLWDAIYERLSSAGSDIGIRSIWGVDFSNQGASGVVNEDNLGNEPSLLDHSRDLLALVNEFRSEMPTPIFGFGHSMGGTALLNLSLMHPRLLSGLILIEPAVMPDGVGLTFSAVYPLTFRRDSWPSREAAVAAHLKNPTHRRWHPRVSELFRQYGFRDLPTRIYPDAPPTDGDKVTLTSTKHQDVLSFARVAFPANRQAAVETFAPTPEEDPHYKWHGERGVPFYRPEGLLMFAQLPSVQPACLFIYGGKSHWQRQNGPEGRQVKREITGTGVGGGGGVKAGQVAEVVIADGSHFVPQERPDEVGTEIANWLTNKVHDWKARQLSIAQKRESIPRHRRAMVSDDWLYWAEKSYKGKNLPEYMPPSKTKL